MFQVQEQSGRPPVLVSVCDVCGRPITEADPGEAVIPRSVRLGKTYLIGHAHAGRCRDVAEERLAKEAHEPSGVDESGGGGTP
jgi:hypothetical protein